MSFGPLTWCSSPSSQGGWCKPSAALCCMTPRLGEDGTEKEAVYASTLAIPGGLEMTTSKDVLEALAEGLGRAAC